MLPRFNKQSGLGLVEVMVAAAMMGGLSLVIMQLTQNSNKGVIRMEKGMEAAELDNEINSLLSDRDNCTASMNNATTADPDGTQVALADMSGVSRYPVEGSSLIVKNVEETPFAIFDKYSSGLKRGQLTLKEVYLTGYSGSPDFTARLIKKYSFFLNPGNEVTKTKSIVISITPDPADPTLAKSCVARSGQSDSVWTVDTFGISYQDGQVAIGKDANIDSPLVLDVEGQIVFGPISVIPADPNFPPNLLTGVENNHHILGGRGNVITSVATTINNMIVGGNENTVVAGADNMIVGGSTNRVSGTNSGIFAGASNVVSDYGSATLGGDDNTIQGTSTEMSIIAGGYGHQINNTGYYSTIMGGYDNEVKSFASVLGGAGNIVETDSYAGVIVGGGSSINNSQWSLILGGWANQTISTAPAQAFQVILGGQDNTAQGIFAAMVGGRSNSSTGDHAIILGGQTNTASGRNSATIAGLSNSNTAIQSVAIGGTLNDADGLNSATIGGSSNDTNGPNSSILGGVSNTVSPAADSSVIIGGAVNEISSKIKSAILGGHGNYLQAETSVILGGVDNYLSQGVLVGGYNASILGGYNNSTLLGTNSVILGGRDNVSIDSPNSIIGGNNTSVVFAEGGVALGTNIEVRGIGSFGLSGNGPVLQNWQDDHFLARFRGGYKFCTNNDCSRYSELLDIAWAYPSDRNLKEDLRPINNSKILSDIGSLDIQSWIYKNKEPKDKRYIGPMAQDFYRLFAKPYGLHSSNKSLSSFDVASITLVGVKALENRTSEMKLENERLKLQVDQMQDQMTEMREQLKVLTEQIKNK